MDMTPDTNSYMIGGFVVFTVTMLGYVWSIYSRWKNLSTELAELDKLSGK